MESLTPKKGKTGCGWGGEGGKIKYYIYILFLTLIQYVQYVRTVVLKWQSLLCDSWLIKGIVACAGADHEVER